MTNRRDLFERNDQLQRFLIANARPTGRQLGAGSYGSVEELEVSGVVCAGKKIHEILIEQGNFGAENIASRYVEECQLMSDLRHPHLVQFLGVCFLPNSTLPVLVMERLLTNLDELLEHNPDIPLSLKRSILADVARGLVYLHSRSPPVIHRDLSAKNVLLNLAMVAKITDLGNARIVNFQPGQLARTLSRIPGTMVYMPPEVSEVTSRYGTSLDSFSFGHLSLFTITQAFPGTLLQYTYRDPENPRRLLGRTEVQRRDEYIKLLHKQLGEQHPLVLLVKQCLDDEPSKRPSAQELLQQLEGMTDQIVDPYQHLTKLEAMRMLKEKDQELTQASVTGRQGRQELEALWTQLEELQVEMLCQFSAKDAEISRLVEEMRNVQLEQSSQLAAKDEQLTEKVAENFRLKEDLRRLQTDLDAREALLQQLQAQTEAEILRRMAEQRDLQSQLQKPSVSPARQSPQPTLVNFQLHPARTLASAHSYQAPSVGFGGLTQSAFTTPKLSFGGPSPALNFRPSSGGEGRGMDRGMGGGSQLGSPKPKPTFSEGSISSYPTIPASLRKRKNDFELIASRNCGLGLGPGGVSAASPSLGPEGGVPATSSGLGLGPGRGVLATSSGLGLGPGEVSAASSGTGFNFSASSGMNFNFGAGAGGGNAALFMAGSSESSNMPGRVILKGGVSNTTKARRRKP